jgi:O-antigen/teichoic acid export membrane protein
VEEIDIASVKKRSVRGIFALVSRTFVMQLITFVANLLLTIFLSPQIFGVYFIVSAIMAFLTYFSDIGLAAALIQKKEKITQEDLKTTFTIQQALVITMVTIALAFSSQIGKFYNLDASSLLLFQALVVSFFLSSLKTIPSIILERNLRFERLVIPQIVETLFFNVVAVVLAIKGFGVSSFTYAVLARGISGLITIYIIAPWRISLGYSRQSAKKLLSFGVPFQLNSLLALIKDDLLIVYLGKVLPIVQVGYLGFAQKWAFLPLRLIMDNVIRITFPSFSRLQDDKDHLRVAVEKSIFAACFIIFPCLMGLVILSPYFINVIPKYTKWEPALFALVFFSINAAFSSVSTPLTNLLNAIGKIKITLYLMVFWTVLTWVLTPLAIYLMGFNGAAVASAVISMSVIIVVYFVKKHIPLKLSRIIIYPLLSTIFMGLIIYFLSPFFANNLLGMLFIALLGAVLYFLSMLLLSKEQLTSNLEMIRNNLKK